MSEPNYETATQTRRPAAVLRRARSLMTPAEAAAARERRLVELEAKVQDEAEGGDSPEAA